MRDAIYLVWRAPVHTEPIAVFQSAGDGDSNHAVVDKLCNLHEMLIWWEIVFNAGPLEFIHWVRP